ncbi:MAG: TetR/AcrR family transcriptional regulator [Paracoccaceae bacterium]
MTILDLTTRNRLITTAALLFRQKGYHATGLAEVLATAQVPKGSLYHHFPEGKSDLARAAADWTATEIMRIIDDAFRPASDFANGAATLCYKLAKLYDLQATATTCPISALLFDGPESETFRAHAEATFGRLTAHVASHAVRLNTPDPEGQAETLLIAIEGGWTIARARRNSDVLRRLPARLFPEGLRIPAPPPM